MLEEMPGDPHRLPVPARAAAPGGARPPAGVSPRRVAPPARAGSRPSAAPSDDRSVCELALHFGQAAALGGAERAIHYALRAAELAARSFAYEEAARRLQEALELGIPDPATRGRTLADLGVALHRVGSAPEALESYAAAAA